MRNTFIQDLVVLAHKHKNIALIVGDLGFSVVEEFAETYPDRFFNAGVAEQNMMGLSAGLASEGMHVFAYSIANFSTFRCAEQIRNDVDYHKLPVTVVSVGGGLAYGSLGYSHHAIQDFGLMRLFPNMLIAAPGDPLEVRACLRYLVENPGPSYLRLAKSGEPVFNKDVPSVKPGHWNPVVGDHHLASHTFLTTGNTLSIAAQALSQKQYNKYCVYSMPLWSSATKSMQASQLAKFQNIISLEDHLHDGGFGSWLREAIAEDSVLQGRLQTKALNSVVCGMVGNSKSLHAAGGLLF